ncbi:glutamine synthetase III [Fulvivirga sedimenti]|uniref:Glutamine synthetase III n=1 Tax=Fulvivirga sedimenti TaxID=2879465 RepID=A0A9X1HN87_9BACT|nr:glutamine synthetase III [Fulvivirga sedimenti]MCA6075283.1 glutamine synthetase III [Fulvivirga sedimenti]MCA6076460.1 glutamine synthetase III [Fulvivirga sedimenti]MCA6077588.1 glutamine synthetase III [Fulvivirga sedimenti]
MTTLRKTALERANSRPKIKVESPGRISEYFGRDVFGLLEMQKLLAPDVFKKVSRAIDAGTKIDIETADAVASAAKSWATTKGATHYTHWFQPLTGSTAEKHDTFFDALSGIEKFKGTALVQQEPDASSFPSGGIRSTFEARGYTAWDPTSPMFIYGVTLCIPTIFVSFTGELLDNKAPLMKAVDAVDAAATRVVQLFDKKVTRVKPSLGCEQEYFVVDKDLYNARPDLVMGGRTVFGHNPARGQQLDDHYFGSIPPRIYNFMKDFEIEALKLGIPVSTRHNEVAPSQFEVAPVFEDINVATDHNQLLMDVMSKVAEGHNLKVLFHEKPFAGLNGTGKHNNWSLITNTGINLFKPSSSARENLLFLVFFVNTIKAVYEYADLLRASIASAGNDHRLGANEAPPAIMSVFIGSTLTSVLDELEKNGNVKVEKGDNMYMKLGIDKIPQIILDNTDRNRTSPFAFTGNKFEFRAVGGAQNVAAPMTVLNLIVAQQLNEFYTEVEKEIGKGAEKRMAVVNVLRKYIKDSKKIRFEGDGYSDEWVKEAAKRGLENVKDTPRALDAYITKKSKKIFEANGVLSEKELEARNEIYWENYIMKIQIESRVMGDLAANHIVPTAVNYQNKLIQNANGLKGLGISNKEVVKVIEKISGYIHTIQTEVDSMIEERKRVNKIEDTREKAIAYCDDVKGKYFDKIRYAVDKLELLVDDEDWPLVKYREMLFLR